ncbi:MAG TPA: hypothetical protein PKL73_07120 [Polyangiaceae bacterium]|jgi:hypothetical protein|nr:MAG: hypothetical protein BWY17_02644 [Deltaproteobacteria bacterium ADurb.Bin207]HNS96706.1 hypothetical protein [Polyangiaceae bacterium]HNZ22415.1 hypothetical protein [Polyangiaceae bacterium]HOH00084.1 hypothetical protein [Polyangiaceae bacterium]HOT10193.1 hypothetical protein [Polyangiaceae bacterium]
MGKLLKTIFVGVLGAASFGLLACGSEPGSPSPSGPEVAGPVEAPPLAPGVAKIGTWRGEWNATTQKLTFTEIEADNSAGFDVGMQPQGFDKVKSGKIRFSTEYSYVGEEDDEDCPLGRVCGRVRVENISTRLLNSVYVEIVSLSPAEYTAHDFSDEVPPGYPMSNQYGLWGYNNLGPGNAASRDWTFANPAGQSFSFSVRVLAIFTRTNYDLSFNDVSEPGNTGTADWDNNSPVWRDACTHGTTLVSSSTSSFAASITMPFPFTITNKTFSTNVGELWVTSYGLGWSKAPEPILPASLPASGYINTLFPFWEQVEGAQVCHSTEGLLPNRRFIVTWKNAHLKGLPNSNLTFSAVLQEKTDNVFFLYHRWSDGSDDCASGTSNRVRNESAAIGIQGDNNYFPSNPVGLFSPHAANCPGSGYFVKFEAQPANKFFPPSP